MLGGWGCSAVRGDVLKSRRRLPSLNLTCLRVARQGNVKHHEKLPHVLLQMTLQRCTKPPKCGPHLNDLMANSITPNPPLPMGRLPADTIEGLPRDNSDLSMGSPPPPSRKQTFGMLEPLTPESEQSDFGMHPPFPESEDEPGKHAFILFRA